MRRDGMDIGCKNVRLDPVALGIFGRERVIDRVDQREQRMGSITRTDPDEGEDPPT